MTEETPKEFLPGFESYDAFSNDFTAKLIQVIRQSNGLPEEQDHKYYSTFKPYKQKMSDLSRKLMSISQTLLDNQTGGKFQIMGSADQAEELDRFDAFSGAGDKLLENVDIMVDALKGINNNRMGITTYIERPQVSLFLHRTYPS